MRYIRILIWTLIGIILILFAISNNQISEIRFLPTSFGNSFSLKPVYLVPLFILLYISLGIGLILGFLFEYVRGRKYRSRLRRSSKDISLLQMEIKKLKSKNLSGDREILNLIDGD